MSKESYESHKPFAKEKKPSMKRRAPENDYCSRRMYMITLNVEGRQPLLGSVEGHSDQPVGSPDAPHLVPSPLGEAVSRCWWNISHYHPEVEVIALQLMPDHLHGILFVREQMPVPLGKVVLGFKQGCNKAFRQLSASLPHPEVEYADVIQQQTRPDAEGQTGPRAEGQTAPSAEGQTAPSAEGQTCPSAERLPAKGYLFERGYNDRILLHAGQLDRWKAYLRDNPRRLLMKRERPDLFRLQQQLHVAGYTFDAIGNRFLLDWPVRLQVQCSRSLTSEQIESKKEELLQQARQGAVLVSPSISPGEKAIMRAAVEEGLPVITLVENGLTPYTKPTGRSMETCATGKLLILAPWQHHNERLTIRRDQCLELNTMAHTICQK